MVTANATSSASSNYLRNNKEQIHASFLDFDRSPRKNPWVAGGISALLPGAGQAYAGNWQAAGLALILNAIFLGATVDFVKKDMPGATAASAGVFSIVYVGNILSAVQGANAYSNRLSKPAENRLKDLLIPELRFDF